jgi:hypothetical protein
VQEKSILLVVSNVKEIEEFKHHKNNKIIRHYGTSPLKIKKQPFIFEIFLKQRYKIPHIYWFHICYEIGLQSVK